MPTTSETTGRGHQQERGKENVGNGSWLDFRQSEEHEREEGEGAAKAARARDVGAAVGDGARQVVGRQQQWGADRRQQASPSSVQMPMRGSPHASQSSQSTFETATSRAGGGGTEGWTAEDNDGDASPIIPSFPASATSQRSTSAQSQNPSLSAVAGGVTKPLQRWNSTRRYMAQLDPDEETESLADEGGDRATWASDPRDSLAELPAPRRSGLGREGVSKEMTMSSMTMESTGGDPFHYSVGRELILVESRAD